MTQGNPTDFDYRGFRIHYGEYTGVWWLESLHGSLNGIQFKTREAAMRFADANAE